MWLLDNFLLIGAFYFTGVDYVSVGIFGLGMFWGVLGLWEFYRVSTTVDPHNIHKTRRLVDSGIYRLSRNPMYVGLACMLISAIFYFQNICTAIVLPLFVWYMNHYQIIPEEEMMEKKFGEQYLRYKEDVRRWV